MKQFLLKTWLTMLCLLVFGSGTMWGEDVQIYLNEGATGTINGITASGNVNTNESNGNPGNSFANTSSSNTTFSFSGFDVSSYSDLKLVLDAKWASFPSTTNTFPSLTVKAYKNDVEVFSDATTIAVNSKVTTYNEYTVNITADFDKIVLTSNPSVGKTGKGAASTVYSLYMDNIKVMGTQSSSTNYSIFYNANGATTGSVPTDNNEYEKDASVTVLGNTGSLAKTGYSFANWNTKADGSGTDYAAGDNFNIAGNTTLYAKWAANNYFVTFDKNAADATGTMDNQQIAFNSSANLTANAFTRPHFTFTGWAKTATGSKFYNDQASYMMATEGATLYAVWTGNKTTITLDKQSGTGGTSSVTAYYGQAMPTLSTTPTRTGYDFTGYYSETNGQGTKYYNADKSSTATWESDEATATLYAGWNPKTITLTLDKGAHGVENGTAKITYGTSTLINPTFVEATTGYTLDGYYTTASGGSKVLNPDGTLGNALSNWIDANGKCIKTSDATLYAHYTPINYDVTWVANGESWAGKGGSTTAAYDTKVAAVPTTLPAFDYTEKTFVGWTTNENYDNESAAPSDLFTTAAASPVIAGPTTFYAVFADLEGTSATFDPNTAEASNNLTWTSNGITLNLSAGQLYTSGSPKTFTVTGGTSNYFRITSDRYDLTKIITNISEAKYKINSVTAGTLSTSGTTQTVDAFAAGTKFVDCKATSSQQIRATLITVLAGSYSNYSTALTALPAATVSIDPAEINVVYGKTADVTLSVNVYEGEYDGTISVASTNESIASVEYNNGVATITGVKGGSARLHVTAPATDAFRSINQYFDITVEKANTVVKFFQDAEEVGAEALEFTYLQTPVSPVAKVFDEEGNELSEYTVTYSKGTSSKYGVNATTGELSLLMPFVKSLAMDVTATFAGNDYYKNSNASYSLYINKATPVIEFAQDALTVAADEENVGLEATATSENVTIEYSSSNTDVADFDDINSHVLTLKSAGTTVITAKAVGNDYYYVGNSINYTLTVTEAVPFVVTLHTCGNDVDGETTLKVLKNHYVELPSATIYGDYDDKTTTYTFKGWATSETSKTATMPSLVDNNYKVTANVDLYPVFQETKVGDVDYVDAWRAAELSEITDETEVLIVSRDRWIKGNSDAATYIVGPQTTIEDGGYILDSKVETNVKWYLTKNSDNTYTFTSYSGRGLFNLGCNFGGYARWNLASKGNKTYSMEWYGASAPYAATGSYLGLLANDFVITTEENSNIQFFIEDFIEVPGASQINYLSSIVDYLELDENATSIASLENVFEKVIVKRTLKADTWNSFCVPFAMSADDITENFGDGAEVKALSGLTVDDDNYSLKFENATIIEARKPYMVRVKNAVNEITVFDVEEGINVDTRAVGSTSAYTDDMNHAVDFHGNFTKQLAPRDSYIISSNNFYFVDSDVNLKGFRGYFTVESANSNKAVKLNFSFDDILTGIEGVTAEGLDNNIFDLQGRRVMNAKSGMYIMNGKKVIR